MSEKTSATAGSASAQFTGEEICLITRGKLHGQLPQGEISIATDTRTLKPGQVYLALRGETFDGAQFIDDAIECGAAACIVSRGFDQTKGNLIVVEDALAAYHALASQWRQKIDPIVVGITGSSGKTTTKEMCAAVFARSLATHKSQANENNEFGVPKTILSMPANTQVLVVEMAMRGTGQIAQLSKVATPNIGIITCAGSAHIELLGSLENIAKAKCELLEYLAPQGRAIIGQSNSLLLAQANQVFHGDLHAFDAQAVVQLEVNAQETLFQVSGMTEIFAVKAHGQLHLQDAWCAITAGKLAALTASQIAQGLADYQSLAGRGTRHLTACGATVIDDSYNANPESVRCAVEKLVDTRVYPHGRKILVLGEMAELGTHSEQMHLDLGEWLRDQNITALYTVGDKAARIALGAEKAKFEVKAFGTQEQVFAVLNTLDESHCIVIKGSHRAALDRLVSALTDID